MGSDDELVLGLPRERVPGGLGWRGVRPIRLEECLDAIWRHGTYRRRAEAEVDPSWKQVIPYLLLRDGERIFLMRRSRAGGDARLFDRYTIGIGGHVNPGDGGPLGGLAREWREELVADFEPEFETLGMLNDDDNPVGAVHLGIVFHAEAAGRPVGVRETDKLAGDFAEPADVAAVAELMETWSRLLHDFLAGRRAAR
ncbi:MAG TPA: NUDIX domain-containing protein [Candidatus Limnocylindria bacterium]|nr:NUDIX domain-containing protein [Candidatus Limnocylindria bacterium]